MIKLALVFLIFKLDFISTKPVFDISEKYSNNDGESALNNEVKSEVESAMKNLVKERVRSLDVQLDSNLASESRLGTVL